MALVAFAAAQATAAAVLEVTVVDAGGTPLPDAAVYAIPIASAVETRARPATVEQLDREFIPYMSVVQVGTSVAFPNRDAILHHVYSFSPAKSFEIKLYTGNAPTEIVFDKPGVVTLGCNIHDWMVAYLLIVATPHFAKTDNAGAARIRDLPGGAYEIRTWHPQQRAAVAMYPMTFDASGTQRAAFVVDAAPRKAKFKPPLDRLRY